MQSTKTDIGKPIDKSIIVYNRFFVVIDYIDQSIKINRNNFFCCQRNRFLSAMLASFIAFELQNPITRYFIAVAIWPVTGQGFQNTKWPAALYSQ